jgi:hypothetical protein
MESFFPLADRLTQGCEIRRKSYAIWAAEFSSTAKEICRSVPMEGGKQSEFNEQPYGVPQAIW